MSNRRWKAMSDSAFDDLLMNTVPDFPPGNILSKISPWRKSIDRILAGLALLAFNWDFWGLRYLIPSMGALSLLLGFRTLRRENKWFMGCFVISILRITAICSMLILNTTIIPHLIRSVDVADILGAANLFLLLAEAFFLCQAFLCVQRKAEQRLRTGGTLALMFWYTLMYLLRQFQLINWATLGFMIIGYISIILSLYQLSDRLDGPGYMVRPVPIKASDRFIILSLIVVLLAGSLAGYSLGHQYPMKWSVLHSAEHQDVKEIKQHLISLGFPEHVLNDLTADEITACDGALQVVVEATDRLVQEGKMDFTSIAVLLPGEQNRWMIFYHFLWTDYVDFYGTDAIRLSPVHQGSENWISAGDMTGRILYDEGEETFVADYYTFGPQSYTSTSPFWTGKTFTSIFAEFSMPQKGHRHRGYVTYSAVDVPGSPFPYFMDAVEYVHQMSWLQYPVLTAAKNSMDGNERFPFKTMNFPFQFRPTKYYDQ